MEWKELISQLGLFAILSTALSYLLQKFINRLFDHREQLINQRLESFKTELERGSYKHARLHDLRLKAIEELIPCMTQLSLALNKLVGIRRISGVKERDDAEWNKDFMTAVDAYNKFLELADEKGWLLEEVAGSKLDELRLAAVNALSGIEYNRAHIGVDPKSALDLFREASENVRKVIPSARKELQAEFLRILSSER